MESTNMDIKRYFSLIRRRNKTFVFTALFIMTVFVVVSNLAPEVYEASSTVFIERNVINSMIKDITINPSLEERLSVLSYSMKSRSLIVRVLEDLDIAVEDENPEETNKLIKKFQENTVIKMHASRSRGNNMNLFIVSFTSDDPKFARDYVNTLVRRYIEENLSAKRDEAYGANRFLSDQITYFKGNLDKIESGIVDFRKERGIFIATDERNVVEDIKAAQYKLDELENQKKELHAKKRLIEKQIKKEYPDMLISLQGRLNELLLQYTENHPEVMLMKSRIDALKKMSRNSTVNVHDSQRDEADAAVLNPLYHKSREEMAKTELELAGLKAKEDNIKKQLEAKKAYLRSIPFEKKKLAYMEGERDIYRGIYEKLILRLGQSEVSKQMELQDKAATFRIVDPAVLNNKPISPDRVKIILLGILAGFAGGMGAAIFLDKIDNSIRSLEVLKSIGLPVLAVIPTVETLTEASRRRKREIALYTVAGLYMVCILTVFSAEVIGIKITDLIKYINLHGIR
jgi:polysaccharide chain length determinant protein (PEP-CTERM system associated)